MYINSNKKNLDEIASSISQSTFNTNNLNLNNININNFNTKAIPLDSRYYFSTIGLSKKVPLTKIKSINPISSVRNIYFKNNNYNLIKSNSAFSIYNTNTTKLNKEKREIETYQKKSNESSLLNNDISNSLNIKEKEKSLDAINIKVQMMEQYLRKLREKMNRTKFKFFKIVKHNNKRECAYFKEKNERFNEQLKFYFKSDYFYKLNKQYHSRFHFGKNFLNMGSDMTKHYLTPSNPEKVIKLNSDLVLSLLNEEDKDLIHSDPYFFLKDNKYLYKLTRTKFKSLMNKFREESDKINEKESESEDDDLDIEQYYKSTKNKSVPKKSLEEIITMPKLPKSKSSKENEPIIDYKYINKIINEDLNEKLKHLKSKINPVEKEMIQTEKQLNTYKKKNYIFESNNRFYKTFHIRTNKNYFKPYSLEKNRERLIKEKLFCKNINQKNLNEDKDQGIINKYRKQLEEYYSLVNKNKKIKNII